MAVGDLRLSARITTAEPVGNAYGLETFKRA
jgi:hypothetical protein